MLVLFDHGTPAGLARVLTDHNVFTAQSRGWDRLNNGALPTAAEADGFDILVTTDRRIRYQQNLSGRNIAIVVLPGSTKWSRIRCLFAPILAAINAAIPGGYVEIEISFA